MERRRLTAGFLSGVLLGIFVSTFGATQENAAPATAPPEVQQAKFSADQIDQMVAPIALYPDSLLMQIMIASTYPLEIVEADRWRRQNASLKDDALDKALEQQDWDPSIKGLTHFPDLLKRMSDNLDWSKDLGDAFLGQKDDVLAAVQSMRQKASAAGTLQTTKQQTVTKQVVDGKETIAVQPADPQVVYAPTYPPTVYGPTYAPPTSYYPAPAVYGYTPGQVATGGLLSFGVGIGVGALISNGCDWGHNDVYVNNNYHNYHGGGWGGGNANVNVNKNVNLNQANLNNQKWQFNPEHRRNVGYRDPAMQQRYAKQDPAIGREQQIRNEARGFDRSGVTGARGGQGTQQLASTQRPAGGGGGQPFGGGAAPRPGGGGSNRPQTRPAPAPSRGADAFNGYGTAGAARDASRRGAASRGGQSFAGAGPGQRQGGGGAAGFGGGGHGGGGAFGGGGGRGGGARQHR
jgi:hypothetical protein